MLYVIFERPQHEEELGDCEEEELQQSPAQGGAEGREIRNLGLENRGRRSTERPRRTNTMQDGNNIQSVCDNTAINGYCSPKIASLLPSLENLLLFTYTESHSKSSESSQNIIDRSFETQNFLHKYSCCRIKI